MEQERVVIQWRSGAESIRPLDYARDLQECGRIDFAGRRNGKAFYQEIASAQRNRMSNAHRWIADPGVRRECRGMPWEPTGRAAGMMLAHQ